tara:strand:+ start:62132 stop:62824 length:693 start_codon:yes stop_codon:yes gene_type:complete
LIKSCLINNVEHIIAIATACFLAIGCSTNNAALGPIKPIFIIDNLQELSASINRPFIGFPTPNNYSICHGHTCSRTAYIHLSSSQWSTIEALFSPPAVTAMQERKQIILAIALLETMTGKQSGTDKDRAKNYVANGVNGQLDCIDEATNTTVYLRMLSEANLLLYHQQASRTSRGGLFSPHNTATIIDIKSQTRYAVDSWFDNNGEPPVIIPLALWKSGWKPDWKFETNK